MRRAVITATAALALFALASGGQAFPRMTEITLAEPVFVAALDKSGDNTKLSLIYEKIEAVDEGAENANQKYIKTAVAGSAAAAMESLKRQFPREIAVSTAEYFLIGEQAASEGISKYTDYLSRNNAFRLTASVFVVQGSALDACVSLAETKTLDILRNFGVNSGINAVSSGMNFYELLSNKASSEAYTIPALIFSGENIIPSGYAIIKNDKLAGFLDKDAARGYNILKEFSVHSVIESDIYATRLENAHRKISFAWDGDNLKAISIDVEIVYTLIDGQGGEEDNSIIEKAQNSVIRNEIQQNIHYSRLYECDFLGFGEELGMKHPLKWDKISDNWNEIYARTPVSINVKSQLIRY